MDSDQIEMLSMDTEASRTTAIPGPLYPRDLGVVKWLYDDDERLAYRVTFFAKDEHGQPLPDTAVEFYVPDHMMSDGQPGRLALEVAAQRAGWKSAR